MRRLLNMSKSLIGLDIGLRQVKAMQLARQGRDWRVHAAAAFPRTGSALGVQPDEALRIADVLHRQNFSGRRVVLSIPASKLMMSVLELPPQIANVPLDQIARMELARVHQCDANSFEFAQWEVPAPARASKSTHVMAVACRHDEATPLVDSLEDAGFEVQAIECEPCALARATAPLLAASGGLGALLDLGHSAARFSIVYQNVIIYSRVLEEFGLERLCSQLQHQMEIDPQAVQHLLAEGFFASRTQDGDDEARNILTSHFDAVVQELNVSFSYAAHQYPDASIQRLLLSGGGADMPGIADHLGTIMRIEVQSVRPLELVTSGGHAICSCASMTAALGLALYQDNGS